jgi:hypothetical protein
VQDSARPPRRRDLPPSDVALEAAGRQRPALQVPVACLPILFLSLVGMSFGADLRL